MKPYKTTHCTEFQHMDKRQQLLQISDRIEQERLPKSIRKTNLMKGDYKVDHSSDSNTVYK